VREGEPAEDFFVVRSGTLEVSSTGEGASAPAVVNTLGAGDYFGEIGLLEHIVRTASVTATTRCDLYRIPGEVFLDSVTQSPATSAALVEGMTGSLARTHPSYLVTTERSGASS
jgi:CRP-like cAMP-binding protein